MARNYVLAAAVAMALVLGASVAQGLALDLVLRESMSVVIVRAAPPFVSWILAALLAITLALLVRSRRAVSAFIAALLLVGYLGSTHVLALNAASGDLVEYWSGISVSRTSLSELNDAGYCYRSSGLGLKIVARASSARFSYFRGLWPLAFSVQDLSKSLGMPVCSATGAG
jgi:hypothetical protein